MKAAKAIDPTNPTTTASAIQGHGLFRPSPARPGAPGRGGSASARGGSTSSGEPIRGALSGPVASTVAADTGGAAAFVSGTPLAPTTAASDATRAPAERGGGGGAGRGGTTGLAAPAPAPKAGAAATGAAPKAGAAATGAAPEAGAVATGAEPDGAAAAPLNPSVGAFSGAAGRGGATGGREGATGLAGGGVGGA